MRIKDNRKLIYFAMFFYMMIYYIFNIIFITENEYFEMIRIGFETIALILTLLIAIKLNLKNSKKTLILPAVLIIIIFNVGGQIFEIYQRIILEKNIPNYLFKDTLSVLSSILFFIVIMRQVYKKRKGKSTLVLTIDIIILMCISVAFTWVYMIEPNISNLENMNILRIIIYIIYPLSHLGTLAGSIMLYNCLDKQDSERKSIFIFSLAFLFMYLTNMGYIYLLTKDSYVAGNLLVPLWTVYDFLLIIAAIEYSYSANFDRNKEMSYRESTLELNIIFPAISILGLFIFTSLKYNLVVWVCFGISIFLINIRHIVIAIQKRNLILELEKLNTCLEEKVEDRTNEIYEVAFYDHLTGLANRRFFEEKTQELMDKCDENAGMISILLLDLDRFKIINDNYGHKFGDLLIKEIADMLKEFVDKDCLVSRQDGDEFAIVIKNVEDKTKAKDLSEYLLKKAIQPIHLKGQRVYVTFSIGIATYPCDGDTYEDIIGCADLAMYNSKQLGRNTYSFYEKHMLKSDLKELTLERELYNAIDKEQFILYYQPQVDSFTREVIGLEALIRWNHPTEGILSPFKFIDMAEDTGLIGPIGKWVLHTACLQAKKWHDKGFKGLKIGVNISVYQFEQDNFIEIVRSVLVETKIDPRCLDLEITESIAMRNEIVVISKLKKLKKLGIQVSMDDFGTGYSSLSYLNRLPIDTLKIPREFIIGIKSHDDKKNIVDAIISIAKNLELSIIAEGVENKMQLKYLKTRDCNLIQGYLFSKPLPVEKVESFLNEV